MPQMPYNNWTSFTNFMKLIDKPEQEQFVYIKSLNNLLVKFALVLAFFF